MEYATKEELDQLAAKLTKHEALDAREYAALAHLCSKAATPQWREIMSEGINTDKVIVNAGGAGESGSNLGAMAAIAALGNRNQGNDNAALIAALGNRNDDASNLGPLMAMAGGGGGWGGGGMNAIWPIVLLALLGRRGFGGGGGDDCCNDNHGVSPAHAALLQTLLEGQSDLKAQVPTVSLETQNAIQSSIAQFALGTQQGFANVKDAVQSLGLFQTGQLNNINQNVSDQGCKTREVVQAGTTAVLQRIDDLRIRELEHERDRHERQVEIQSLRSQVEITNVNTATATAAQAQTNNLLQFQDLNHKLNQLCGQVINLGNQVQFARNMNDTINFGTMAASANQSAPTTQVR